MVSGPVQSERLAGSPHCLQPGDRKQHLQPPLAPLGQRLFELPYLSGSLHHNSGPDPALQARSCLTCKYTSERQQEQHLNTAVLGAPDAL